MPEQRSFIETLTPSDHVGELIGTMRIRPVVADSSFLISEILRSTRSLHQSAFLEAIKSGVLRPFAAQHVWAEVPRKLEIATRKQHLDTDLAMRVWWQEYVSRLRFVDVSGLSTSHATALLERDRSDIPTAALARLLAPAVVLSSDPDLQDTGFAVQKYCRVVDSAGSLTVVAEGTWASMVGVQVMGSATGAAVRGISALARRREGRFLLAVVVGALVIIALLRGSRLRGDGRRFGQRFGGFVQDGVLPFLETTASVHAAANALWDEAAYKFDESSMQQQVARALAVSPHPLNRTQLAGVLLPDGTDAERRRMVSDLAAVLASVPAFSPASKRRWELGRAGVDFGGFGDQVPDPLQVDPLAKTRHLRAALESRHTSHETVG
jgi:hypothetical protein